MAKGGLTPRQARFAAEFIKDGKASQAAVRAGFSEKGAHTQANRMLKNATVCAEIERLRAPIVEAAQITLADHLKTLGQLREKAVKAEQFSAAVSAEVSRGKASGLYTEKLEHAGEGGGPLHVTITRRVIRANADA
jgi:phage terminase small subunit